LSSLREYVRRRVLPSLVVLLSRIRAPRAILASLRRVFGKTPTLELYFAYDDPYAAVALKGVVALAKRHGAKLALFPLLERGIPDDPAAVQRQRHTIVDAGRLLEREGRRLSRRIPVAPEDAAFLASWTQAAQGHPALAEFAVAAIEQLWVDGNGPVRPENFFALHRQVLGREPPPDDAVLRAMLAANHARLLARGHWESPAARLDGEWFFAHERLPAMAVRLAALQG
jgi:2-hydroxychromene-2-carboxylate isomerase